MQLRIRYSYCRIILKDQVRSLSLRSDVPGFGGKLRRTKQITVRGSGVGVIVSSLGRTVGSVVCPLIIATNW